MMKTVASLGAAGAWRTPPTWSFLASPIRSHSPYRSRYSLSASRCLSSGTSRARRTDTPTLSATEATSSRGSSPVTGEVQSTVSISAPTGNLSIVFTDIVKSTEIWESNISAMTRAMQRHDAIIRSATPVYQGYEVKQNGDGFMIAFPNVVWALHFCLTVQQQLNDTAWPPELLEMYPSKEITDDQGNVLFRGLRLRMSAHWGTPVCNWNSVIGRMDYLGPMVNRAARFVEVTEGGQIVVSEDFLKELQKANRDNRNTYNEPDKDDRPEDASQLQDDPNRDIAVDLKGLPLPKGHQEMPSDLGFEVRPLGEHHLKGLKEPETLYLILPQSLHARLEHWPKNVHVPGSKGNLTAAGGG